MATISFTLAGRQFDLSEDEVRARVAQHRPESIDQYWVEIDGTRWPVKQVMALATGLGRSDFQSQNSRRLLTKLGFTVGKGSAPLLPSPKQTATMPAIRPRRTADTAVSVDVVLVGCVKSKTAHGAPAKDLYTSDYFAKMRSYAETSGRPWFILSAEHGLVDPDEWLEPYDCYLPNTSREYRSEWGRKVAAQLEQAIGTLNNVVIDIHAGSVYVESASAALLPQGAVVIDQLEGLSFGRRLSWYLDNGKPPSASAQGVAARLRDRSGAVALSELLDSKGAGLRAPGMYSWWVDDEGAADLSDGLGHLVPAGLVYAGLAGATRSGGSASANTLWGRISTMHLGKRHNLSTLRLSIGSTLAEAHGWPAIDEAELTAWMHAHLRVLAIPVSDADTLRDLETEILAELDPPLNLAKVPKTPLRATLSRLRKRYGGRAAANAGELDRDG